MTYTCTTTSITTAYTRTSKVDGVVYVIVNGALIKLSRGKATIITIIKQSVNESRFSLFIIISIYSAYLFTCNYVDLWVRNFP